MPPPSNHVTLLLLVANHMKINSLIRNRAIAKCCLFYEKLEVTYFQYFDSQCKVHYHLNGGCKLKFYEFLFFLVKVYPANYLAVRLQESDTDLPTNFKSTLMEI